MIDESVDRWLTMLERNRGTWLAANAARGLGGGDPELEAILEEAREQAADRLIEALQTYEAADRAARAARRDPRVLGLRRGRQHRVARARAG